MKSEEAPDAMPSEQAVRENERLAKCEAERDAAIAAAERFKWLLKQSETFRAAQANILRESGEDIDRMEELRSRLEVSEADRAARLAAVERLGRQLQASDADRAARLDRINELGKQLAESEADREARLHRIQELERQLAENQTLRGIGAIILHKIRNTARRCLAWSFRKHAPDRHV